MLGTIACHVFKKCQNICLEMIIYTDFYTESHTSIQHDNTYPKTQPKQQMTFSKIHFPKIHLFQKLDIQTHRNLMFIFMVLLLYHVL